MSVEWKVLIGVGGVPPHDYHRAYVWEHRLRWIMAAIAMLSVPAFYLEEVATAVPLKDAGQVLEMLIVLAFSAELLWMAHLTEHRRQYLVRNWLDVLIIVCSLAMVIGFTLLSLMTAYVASIFIGEDEKRLRRETHHDIQLLKDDVAKLVSDEERDIRRELRHDIRLLREDLARLRSELVAQGVLTHRRDSSDKD